MIKRGTKGKQFKVQFKQDIVYISDFLLGCLAAWLLGCLVAVYVHNLVMNRIHSYVDA